MHPGYEILYGGVLSTARDQEGTPAIHYALGVAAAATGDIGMGEATFVAALLYPVIIIVAVAVGAGAWWLLNWLVKEENEEE